MLDAARTGAPWAFESLYHELAPKVAAYLRMRGAAEPEDLTNEVFIGVFRGAGRFEGDVAAFRSWVFTIAHRRLVDERRRSASRPQTTELRARRHDDAAGDVEHEALDELDDIRVRGLLDRLSDIQREVILLRVIADLSVEQTAAVLGKRPGAVKMAQRRGLAELRRILEREGVTS